MATLYRGHWDNMNYMISDLYQCTPDRKYVNTPILLYGAGYLNHYVTDHRVEVSFDEFVASTLENITEYTAFIEDNPETAPTRGTMIRLNTGAVAGVFTSSWTGGTASDVASLLFPIAPRWAVESDYSGGLDTNIPIFLYADVQYYNIYIDSTKTDEERLMAMRHAINYSDVEREPLDGKEFMITNPWQHGTWGYYGPSPDTDISYRNVRGKLVAGRFALYNIGLDNGALKMGFKATSALFTALQYSTDGVTWEDTDDFPFTFFYKVRTDELGTFSYGLALGNNTIPEFESEEDADDYIAGTKPIEEAVNWPIISPNYPDPITPGDPDTETEFGEVGARSIFSQQYIVPIAVLYEIANTFYDTTTAGLWDDIKKGLQMYGDSPIEDIENLSYYPYDLTSVFPGADQNYIYFGGYQMNLTQGDAYKIANPNGSIDLGSVMFKRIRNNWMDFEPYCKLFVNIPYCGEYQLDLSEYYDKELSVKYFIDTRTGSCCCCLLANDHLIDKFNGQIGTQYPIKLTDFSAYANAQIQTLLGFGGQAAQNTSNISSAAVQGMAAGGGGLALAGAGALAGGMGAVIGAKTVYGLAQNNINRFTKTKGGSTSMLNMYMPQTVCFTFEMNEPDIPDNFYQLNGYPSNASGNVGKFAGYLKCDTVKLSMAGATDAEMSRARALLLSGVYV